MVLTPTEVNRQRMIQSGGDGNGGGGGVGRGGSSSGGGGDGDNVPDWVFRLFTAVLERYLVNVEARLFEWLVGWVVFVGVGLTLAAFITNGGLVRMVNHVAGLFFAQE